MKKVCIISRAKFGSQNEKLKYYQKGKHKITSIIEVEDCIYSSITSIHDVNGHFCSLKTALNGNFIIDENLKNKIIKELKKDVVILGESKKELSEESKTYFKKSKRESMLENQG